MKIEDILKELTLPEKIDNRRDGQLEWDGEKIKCPHCGIARKKTVFEMHIGRCSMIFENRFKIEKMIESGMNNHEIAKEFGLSNIQISRFLKQLNLKAKVRKKRFEKNELVKKLYQDGRKLTGLEIAAITGIPRTTVQEIQREFGLPDWALVRIEEAKVLAKELKIQGLHNTEISKKVGFTTQTIRKWLQD